MFILAFNCRRLLSSWKVLYCPWVEGALSTTLWTLYTLFVALLNSLIWQFGEVPMAHWEAGPDFRHLFFLFGHASWLPRFFFFFFFHSGIVWSSSIGFSLHIARRSRGLICCCDEYFIIYSLPFTVPFLPSHSWTMSISVVNVKVKFCVCCWDKLWHIQTRWVIPKCTQ